jgi:ABC-2 type transport system ATP-binding protein
MQHEFLKLVREAQSAERTVFLSSHSLSEVQRAADRVAVLSAGKVVASGTVSDLRKRARQRIEVWFDGAAPEGLRDLPGIEDVDLDGSRFSAVLVGPVQEVLEVLARHPVASLIVEEPDLEDAFIDLFRGAQA